MTTTRLSILGAVFAALALPASGQEAYRTDQNNDPKLPWFQPVEGEFPPEGSAHYVSGELIGFDHPERKVILRVDRNDGQERALMDYPLTASMLPYGSIYYLNQPAALQDIPIGTHLHGWFYERPKEEKRHWMLKHGKLHNEHHVRASPEVDFTRCLRLEDDFSYHARRNQVWKVDAIDLAEMKLTASLQEAGKAIGETKTFDLLSHTTIYQESGFGTLKSIQPGQKVRMNLTWATLYGPGRISHIWLDQKSRDLASARQLERHRNHIRERGIPGWVDAVDDKEKIVTLTFFDGVDTDLFKDFDIIVPEPLGWPTSGGAKDDSKPKGTLAVARECLMTYDPVNDCKGGNIVKRTTVPRPPGCSGLQIQVQCGMLLEGYRPGGIVRFFPAAWNVVSIPREEQFHGRE